MTDLQVQSVSKRFGGLDAVSGVSMEVPRGQVTGLIGPNGAGKSTLINIISGVLCPTRGAIFMDGREVTNEMPDVVAKAGIARTFQNLRLFPELTVLENVLVGYQARESLGTLSKLLGLPSARASAKAQRREALELLEQFEMHVYRDQPVSALAYGHQRRVELMRGLATAPRILLLDEPAAGLNAVETKDLEQLLRRLAGEGVGVLLVEHDVAFVMDICDRIYVLDHGVMISHGTPAHVRSDETVIAAYLGGRHA